MLACNHACSKPDKFNIDSGVRPEDAWSTLLFNLVLAGVTRKVDVKIFINQYLDRYEKTSELKRETSTEQQDNKCDYIHKRISCKTENRKWDF